MTKPTKWHVHPVKTQISLGIRPVCSVFAIRSLGSFKPTAKTLIRLGGCSESLLVAQVSLLVLSCGGSNLYLYINMFFNPYSSTHAFYCKTKNKNFLLPNQGSLRVHKNEPQHDKMSSGVSDLARHKPAWAATKAS